MKRERRDVPVFVELAQLVVGHAARDDDFIIQALHAGDGVLVDDLGRTRELDGIAGDDVEALIQHLGLLDLLNDGVFCGVLQGSFKRTDARKINGV